MQNVCSQPDIYQLAAGLARRFDATHIVDIGCADPQSLTTLHPEFAIVGIDHKEKIASFRLRYIFGTWLGFELDRARIFSLPRAIVRDSILICSYPNQGQSNSRMLLEVLSVLSRSCRALIVTTVDHPMLTNNWSVAELQHRLEREGIRTEFAGLASSSGQGKKKENPLLICGNAGWPALQPAAPDFRVLAIMTSYNEEDIIVSTIESLLDDGIEVHLIDNWSTDTTFERALSLAGRGRLTAERFPPTGPSATYRWRSLLDRVDEVALGSRADWCVHHDADERRRSPWSGVSLRHGLYHVDRCGFNAVEHTVVNFWPVDDGYKEGIDPEEYFRYFTFGEFAGHFVQVKAWQNPGRSVRLSESGGHEAHFPGRRVIPFNFLLKHYPIRSQSHGERKVLRDRVPRWDPEEKAGGWHIQYDHIRRGHRFLRDPQELRYFDDSFDADYLLERISHVGRRSISQG